MEVTQVAQQSKLHLLTEPSHEPICNVDVEESVIGALLLDPDAYIRVCGTLRPDYFYVTGFQLIYRAIEVLEAQGKRSDLTTVAAELSDRGELQTVGGQFRLVQLLEKIVSSANVDLYAELVREKWIRRQMLALGGQIQHMARQPGQVTGLISEIRDRLDSLTGGDSGQWKDVPALQQELKEHSQDIVEGKKTSGVAWGFVDIDTQIQGGSSPKALQFLAGRPGMGKTALMLNAAAYSAQSVPTGIFSMEMDAVSLMQRMVAMRSGVWLSAIQSMKMQEQDLLRFRSGLSKMSEIPNLFIREARLTVDELCNEARVAIARYGLRSIWIDHLHEFPNAEDTAELTRICNRLKNLSFKTGVAVNVLAQLNRSVDGRTNKRPMMSDLRQSGTIEQVAEKIILLYRDDYYNPQSPDRGVVEVTVAKQRNGPTGTVKLLFEPEFSRFRNLARGGSW